MTVPDWASKGERSIDTCPPVCVVCSWTRTRLLLRWHCHVSHALSTSAVQRLLRLTVPDWASKADALLYAGYPGEEAGTSLADVLFGDYSPGGRLPYTIPTGLGQVRAFEPDLPSSAVPRVTPSALVRLTRVPTGLGQLPPFESYDMATGCGSDGSCGRTYRYLDTPPLWRFGDGLSYSSFKTTALTLSSRSIKPCENVSVSVTVANVGAVDADEVTQLYIQRAGTADLAPRLQLAGNITIPHSLSDSSSFK